MDLRKVQLEFVEKKHVSGKKPQKYLSWFSVNTAGNKVILLNGKGKNFHCTARWMNFWPRQMNPFFYSASVEAVIMRPGLKIFVITVGFIKTCVLFRVNLMN